MPRGVHAGTYALKCSVAYNGPEPDRIWTLYLHTDQNSPPSLPFRAYHHQNAFLEDKAHDWNIRDRVLNYFSRASEGGNWLLLEFKPK